MKKIISIDREITFTTMIKEITSICLDHTLKFVTNNSVEGDLIVSGTYKMTEASRLEEEFDVKIPVSISTIENYVLDTALVTIDDFSYEVINDDVLNVKIDILLEGVEEVIMEEEQNKEEVRDKVSSVRECDGDSAKEKVEEVPFKEDNSNIVAVENLEKLENNNVNDVDNDTVAVLNESNNIIEDNSNMDSTNSLVDSNNANDNVSQEKSTNSVIDSNNVNDNSNQEKSINSLFMNLTDEDETFSTYLVYIMRKNDSIEKVLDMYGVSREEIESYNELDNLEVGSKLIIPCKNE